MRTRTRTNADKNPDKNPDKKTIECDESPIKLKLFKNVNADKNPDKNPDKCGQKKKGKKTEKSYKIEKCIQDKGLRVDKLVDKCGQMRTNADKNPDKNPDKNANMNPDKKTIECDESLSKLKLFKSVNADKNGGANADKNPDKNPDKCGQEIKIKKS